MGFFDKFRGRSEDSDTEEGLDLEEPAEEPKVEKEPEGPAFRIGSGYQKRLAREYSDLESLKGWRETLAMLNPEDVARFAKGRLVGKGALTGDPEEIRARLLESLDDYIATQEAVRGELLEGIKGTTRLREQIDKKGAKVLEAWVERATDEELLKAQYRLLGGKGSRSENPEELREFLLEALRKEAEADKEGKGFLGKLSARLGETKIFGKPVTEFLTGGVAGGAARMVIRRGARTAFFVFGGFIGAVGGGAAAGYASGAIRERVSETFARRRVIKELNEGEGGLGELSEVDIKNELKLLEKQLEEAEARERIRAVEHIRDRRRHLLWALGKKMGKLETPESMVDAMGDMDIEGGEESTPEIDPETAERMALIAEIRAAKGETRARILKAAKRGAIWGAVGGGLAAAALEVIEAIRGAGGAAVDEGTEALGKKLGLLGEAEATSSPNPIVIEVGDAGVPDGSGIDPGEIAGVPGTGESIIDIGADGGLAGVPEYIPLQGELASVDVPEGSSIADAVREYFVDVNGVEPTPLEFQGALSEVMEGNGLGLDQIYGPAGADEIFTGSRALDMSGMNGFMHELASGEDALSAMDGIPETIGMLPRNFSLMEGSNPWNESHKWLDQFFGEGNFTNADIARIDRALCMDSKIAWPEAGVTGENWVDHRAIPVGYEMNFGARTRATLLEILTEKSS
ncbi:MAG: hypothetical protein COT89_00725 [Candidatus Colwellbacteria bacterium CG10_big_fil_rev_8_21_14_0_10_42_22]|uniref:Uncharacterized protein n=1 Tax=Candidatus Colwellbacteria bacterium CG10_big_fil_rev_8_21_14_0_10_42_22 TaxID=1974540 RepID=A0A2H0VGK8_9BACT|nr:MAG: hypothetical protein COT89_00725 [Candidatus Colwellbacteria bacterium CG10_big_fil_rev_8_21_14_0_10_42_22]